MKILFTGGGSGGHFYPILSVANEIQKLAKENRLLVPELYYVSDSPYNEGLLYDNNITYKMNAAGKRRMYFSINSFVDLFKTGWGILTAFWTVFSIYPDVVFSKGGYPSFPVVFAAHFFRIPIVIHESDSVPGRANKYAAKFATKIAVSFAEAANFFPSEKVAVTGNPVRELITMPITDGAHEALGLDSSVPTVLVLGGSLGAQMINNIITDTLSQIIEHYQVIHQVGKNNYDEVVERVDAVIYKSVHRNRYKPFDYLTELQMRQAAGVADIVISRAGSAIFEIASWGKPAILIPITVSNGDHQRKNAYAYARTKAAIVIEEANLTSNILISEINRIMLNNDEKQKMSNAAREFFKPDAARVIAKELLSISLRHEK